MTFFSSLGSRGTRRSLSSASSASRRSLSAGQLLLAQGALVRVGALQHPLGLGEVRPDRLERAVDARPGAPARSAPSSPWSGARCPPASRGSRGLPRAGRSAARLRPACRSSAGGASTSPGRPCATQGPPLGPVPRGGDDRPCLDVSADRGAPPEQRPREGPRVGGRTSSPAGLARSRRAWRMAPAGRAGAICIRECESATAAQRRKSPGIGARALRAHRFTTPDSPVKDSAMKVARSLLQVWLSTPQEVSRCASTSPEFPACWSSSPSPPP